MPTNSGEPPQSHPKSIVSVAATRPDHSTPPVSEKRYSTYLDPAIPLDEDFKNAFVEPEIPVARRDRMELMLAPLREKHLPIYKHRMRVGLLGRAIARFIRGDEKELFYAGTLHDCSKALIPLALLDKCSAWTAEDSAAMQQRVMGSHRLLSGVFHFTADVMVWHHRFQKDPHPAEMPPSLYDYSQETRDTIKYYCSLLVLADCYDALHRINCRSGASAVELTGEQIKDRMLGDFIEQYELILKLYAVDIFSCRHFD